MSEKSIYIRAFLFTILIVSFMIYGGDEVLGAKVKAKKSLTPEEILANGREAFFNYEFEEAAELYEQYRSLKTKARKEPAPELELWEEQLNIATNAFDRVQQIDIVDTIKIPRAEFFKAYKLKDSAGKIGMPASFKLKNAPVSNEVSFLNEAGDYLITAVPDSAGYTQLIESRKLLDNTWETREILQGDFEKDGNYAFPFLHGDGQTFYFANDGEGSMGGFDIFVVQKEPITGECLQPLNVGMPFNSPYDDFMMAIDEENGLGWWATDRREPGGDITIYVYKLDEVRKNYPLDTPDLKKFARLN